MTAAAWYLDHKLVAALRVDQRAQIVDATAGMAAMLGTHVDSLTSIELGYFCDHYLGSSATLADLWHLDAEDETGVAAELVDSDGRLRQIRVQATPGDGSARTLLFTDTTDLSSAQSHLVRRMAHDQLLHILVSDLLDGSTRDSDRVVQDVLAGFASYFDFVTAALTLTDIGAPSVVAYASSIECERATFDRLSAELDLLEAPDVDQLLDLVGPGDVWHVNLSAEDQYALHVDHAVLTCLQVAVPYEDDEELSFIASLGGKLFPGKADLELVHKALSHVAQFLRRATAEQRIRRHSALDEAMASTRAQLLNADQPTLLQALQLPAERIGAITECSHVALRPMALVHPLLQRGFDGWSAPRPVSPDMVGLDPDVSRAWALPISDGQGPIALLSYVVEDERNETETADAWQRLAELVPSASARLDVERRLEAAFQQAPMGIALRDSNGSLIDCNDAFVRFVGAPNATALQGGGRFDLVDLDSVNATTRAQLTDYALLERVELPFRTSNSNNNDTGIAWGRVTTTLVDDGSASVLLDHVEDVTATRATEAALVTARRRDALTGLPNRAEIESHIATRIANNEAITVTTIDLDHFNSVNASLGHLAGDRLLQLVAERLQLTVGPRSQLGRTGGDEFIVVAPTSSQQLALDLGDRILASLRLPFEVNGNELLTGASVGVCISRGETSPSELLLAASDALFEAKQAGRNRVVHRQSGGSRRRVGLFESELRRAVHERSLDVYYQPEFDVGSRLIVGAEALVRWNHPTDGLLAAGAFVPLIEEIGLSTELCDYVLHEACTAGTDWLKTLAPNKFTIRINLSPRDIEQPNIVERVMATVNETGLPVSSLCLEITETAVMRDQGRVVQNLHAFADLGVSLAIDDFGTGFSSLWLLRELPFDTLKIDQAFIAALDSGDPQNRAIVETIVTLGHTLGMEVTAEGVETESQFEALRSIGIKRAQGFLLARPEPRASLELALQQH